MSGCKREGGSKGGKEIVGTESFGFGGEADVILGGRIVEVGGEDGWDKDRELNIVNW